MLLLGRYQDWCLFHAQDALDEIARQRPRDLFKPLRVHFIGEPGIDAGGLKKEFFQLLLAELLTPDYGMLIFQPVCALYYVSIWTHTKIGLAPVGVRSGRYGALCTSTRIHFGCAHFGCPGLRQLQRHERVNVCSLRWSLRLAFAVGGNALHEAARFSAPSWIPAPHCHMGIR